ncbi:DUF192 domain-containing protein [Haloarcula pellucida]|uniref:DUF192 domain-containing protein n=1 Tax=Haloarcula pellucida TaxID=1427151 RepID=A0A830GNW8_9EURY|nr:DUF192 domain-containing protein [Halomicroarcula pellucida]MBX0349027.1 DUF192 domain-containing protein [Halomicroarcula pellucida]GGN98660.1 hypothetical protein GCM10009030_29310 [Halomicroarcula pellucida]
MQRGPLAVVLGLVGLLVVGVLVLQSGLWVSVLGVGEYDEGTVTVREGTTGTASGTTTETATQSENATTVAVRDDAERLATVEVRIADTGPKRYLGLSNTTSLEPNEGMLFVHDEEGEYGYVMRDMDFPLDIIFVDANGTITTIHHAPLPPEGTSESELKEYSGQGKYVLEVNRGWANRTGVTVGDRVELPAGVA